jgi:hypothetical protein
VFWRFRFDKTGVGEWLEHFQKSYSRAVGSGLFGFWLRFGSVTGLFKPAPSPKADDRHHLPKTKNPRSASAITFLQTL